VLLIRDMSFSFSNPTVLNINGSTCAKLPVPPGEQELWHIGNFGSNTFVNLKLEGMQWTLLAMDGNPLPDTAMVDSLYIPPGSRAEVIVTGPPRGTRVRLYSAPFLPRPTAAQVTLGYLVGEGTPRPRRAVRDVAGEDASVLDTLRFLRGARDVQERTFHFDFVGNDAGIDSVIYKPTDLPVAIPWGQVQEWTLINRTGSLHTFHIHQVDFTIMSLNGQPMDERLLRDNIPIGVHPVVVKSSSGRDSTAIVGDTVVVRFTFNPIAAGPFVFHCHVLQHEDEGMMKNVCVYDPNDPDGVNKCNRMFTGGGHGGAQSSGQSAHGGHRRH
jgi:FtsP/CotA-like multicopper oxidase with cupredoxin domain